jgi:hypothetical protein
MIETSFLLSAKSATPEKKVQSFFPVPNDNRIDCASAVRIELRPHLRFDDDTAE